MRSWACWDDRATTNRSAASMAVRASWNVRATSVAAVPSPGCAAVSAVLASVKARMRAACSRLSVWSTGLADGRFLTSSSTKAGSLPGQSTAD